MGRILKPWTAGFTTPEFQTQPENTVIALAFLLFLGFSLAIPTLVALVLSFIVRTIYHSTPRLETTSFKFFLSLLGPVALTLGSSFLVRKLPLRQKAPSLPESSFFARNFPLRQE
jgi:hypothetical protein